MPKLDEARAALEHGERFKRAVANANQEFRTAEFSGDPERIAAARSAYEAAIKAQQLEGPTSRELDRLAQAVLDASEQSHTEERVLPPELGDPLKAAHRAVVHARAGDDAEAIAAADEGLARAQDEYAANVAAHAKGA